MKISECTILIVPGLDNSGPDHWQSRWEAKFPAARRVHQQDWSRPDFDDWKARIAEAVNALDRPGIIVAHSLGVIATAHAAAQFNSSLLRGAFLVCPPDVAVMREHPAIDHRFSEIPRGPLPMPSTLVASRNDPYSAFAASEEMGAAWGSDFSDAGECGHINTDSGHGPWPEGLMRFAGFMGKLKT
jgi:uncharacterized protein